MTTNDKRAAVIVPVQVRDGFQIYMDNLRFTLQALAKQSTTGLAGLEVIVVDYESDEDIGRQIHALCDVYRFTYTRAEVDRQSGTFKEFGAIWNRGAALNAGVAACGDTDFVLFVDADCVVPSNYVVEHVRVCSKNPRVATYALVHDMPNGLVKFGDYKMLVEECGKLDNLRRAGFSHVCIPFEWFVQNGGFDERYFGWGAEDDDLWIRIQSSGIRKVALPGVTPVHLWHPQWDELIGQKKGSKFGQRIVARNRKVLNYGRTVRYGIVSIDTPGSVNLGNRLIEWVLKRVLRLGEPAVTVSMFKVPTDEEILQLNGCKFVLLPGSTILAKAKGNSDALAALKRIRVPVFCVAASGWGPKHPPHLEALKHIQGPVGCRDPQILEVCRKAGKEALLVGCPTAYVEPVRVPAPKVPYGVVGFARDRMSWQVKAMSNLPGKLVSALQEPNYERQFALRVSAHLFAYTDPLDVIRHYAEADFVATGRLHGALPAVSQRKPVYFFGHKDDSRFSLLEYLGIKVNPMEGRIDLGKASLVNVSRLLELRDAMLAWKSATIDKLWGGR